MSSFKHIIDNFFQELRDFCKDVAECVNYKSSFIDAFYGQL